jgi:PqqD family protein of HPr-rel-A system
VRYERTPGVRVESLGRAWAAFSPASGETLLLNDEAAALLEVLTDGPAHCDAVCAALAVDGDVAVAQIHAAMGDSWQQLLQAGLLRRFGGAG